MNRFCYRSGGLLQPAKLVVCVCGDDAVLIRCLCYKPKLFVNSICLRKAKTVGGGDKKSAIAAVACSRSTLSGTVIRNHTALNNVPVGVMHVGFLVSQNRIVRLGIFCGKHS